MNEFLKELGACNEVRVWADGKSWPEIFETCHRGDWLLWLFKRTNHDDLQRLTLAKAHCANTVRHLMKDDRSKNAIDVAIRFGNGDATRDELNAAAYAADAAAYAAYAAAAAAYAAAADAYAAAADAYAAYAAAAYAAYAAAAAAYAAADAAAYAAADAADAADADAAYAAAARRKAREANQKATADICRKYLPIEIWNIKVTIPQ